jgi:hypothetical protein
MSSPNHVCRDHCSNIGRSISAPIWKTEATRTNKVATVSIVRPEHSLSTIRYHQPAATHTASAESRHPPTPTPIVMRLDPAYNHRHPRRSETRQSDRLCSPHACMQIPPVLHVITNPEPAAIEVATTRYTRPVYLPTYLSIDPLVHPPDNQTNLISSSVIRQKPTIDKTDVAVRVPSRPGSQVQDCPSHLVFDSHPLRRNQSPRHYAASVLPCFGDGSCHVGGEPWGVLLARLPIFGPFSSLIGLG